MAVLGELQIDTMTHAWLTLKRQGHTPLLEGLQRDAMALILDDRPPTPREFAACAEWESLEDDWGAVEAMGGTIRGFEWKRGPLLGEEGGFEFESYLPGL